MMNMGPRVQAYTAPAASITGYIMFARTFFMARKGLLSLLEGGDRRTIGRSDRVARIVLKDPGLFPALIAGLHSENPLVRMRAADAAEKVTRNNPALLQPFKKELLGLLAGAKQQELRWHLAVMIPRLALNTAEQKLAASLLNDYLEDRSSIVKTFALQGLADLACGDPNMLPAVTKMLREATRSGTPAMRARSRKLLLQLEQL
jgi:hypothetical protein